MRSLFVISIVLCLGLATAAPTKVEDLLKALLKRQADESAPPAPEKPADHEGMDLSFLPTYEQWGAMQAIGGAIVHMTKLAKEDPMSVIKFVMSVGETIPQETRRALFKRMATGPQGAHGLPAEIANCKYMQEILANGLYDTVIKYTNLFGRMMEHSGAIFEWAIMGPNCTTCTPLPDDLVLALTEMMADSQGPPPLGGPSGAHGGPSGAHGGPSGAYGGPSGARGKGKAIKANKDNEDNSTEDEDSEEERALLKRLLAVLADKK